MTEYYITIVVGIIQIFLSINLIFRQKNRIAILSELISSLILWLILNECSIDVNNISWRWIVLTLAEYFSVKVLLVIFMAIGRMYRFYAVKDLCRKKPKGKSNSIKLNLIRKFNKVKYWPKLRFGVPSMADKRHPITRVKFDSKGFPQFKAYYTVKLRRRDLHKTREQHFYIANKRLYKECLSNGRLRAKFSKPEIKEFSQGKTPDRYTWHHHQDTGVLQLVESTIHYKTSHIGGYSIWSSK